MNAGRGDLAIGAAHLAGRDRGYLQMGESIELSLFD
jgi:hypothetical protein